MVEQKECPECGDGTLTKTGREIPEWKCLHGDCGYEIPEKLAPPARANFKF